MLPKHGVMLDFLPGETHKELLKYIASRPHEFSHATVYREGRQVVQEGQRLATKLKGGLGPYKELFNERVRQHAAAIFARIGVQPRPVLRIETEVVSHNDGGHFGRHIDTLTGASRHDNASEGVRTVSAVYYLFNEPKAFSGGELRLLPFDSGSGEYIDVTPVQNSLVFFPSFAPHEVRLVSCSSTAFEFSRFSVNCWLHCPLT